MMKIQKQKILDCQMVYSTAELSLDGQRYLAAASEMKGERAWLIRLDPLETTRLWEGETGVMNVIQLPGQNRLLAITGFYPVFQSREAAICLLEPTEEGFSKPWNIREVLRLPFCHRIGLVKNANGLFLIACQLCADKDFQEDWSKPGAVWAVKVPDDLRGEWKPEKLYDGLVKNHGLFIDNETQVYVCAENGVLLLDMAQYAPGGEVEPQWIDRTPTSDLWIHREQDGVYAACIEPFHGDLAAVYRLENGEMTRLYSTEVHFGHVVWTGRILGQEALILGSRGEEKQLEILFWRTGERVRLEEGVGPTQISVWEEGDKTKILSANHGSGEIAVYTLQA